MTIDAASVWVLSVFSQRNNSADHYLLTEPVMPPFPKVVRTVPKTIRRVEEEMNGRCPGGGGVDTALG